MSLAPADWWEYAARTFEPATTRWESPGALAADLVPGTRSTPALDLIDRELTALAGTGDQRLIITMAPQEGKSTRVARDFPLWWLTRHPDHRIVTASYGQSLANRNGRTIRNLIAGHPDLGLHIAPDNGAAHDWSLTSGGGVYSVGVGGGLTGRASELMVIDDPVKDQREADSKVYRDGVWDWWEGVAAARLAPGANVAVILTRWHTDDLAGRLLAQPDSEWRVVNIPAQADHDPNAGETDPLGREPGEYMTSARGRTREQWERRKREAGSRKWAAQYQGRPSAAEGNVFHRDWWQTYTVPQWLTREDGTRIVTGMDDLLISWDMAFKGTDQSDYVVGQVWGRRGADAYLLDQVRGRMDFPETVRQVRTLAARWPQATLKLVEDKANGTAVIATLRREIPGMVPIEPDGGKVARATAVAPIAEAGNVWFPSAELAPWVGDLIEELGAFDSGANDDQVDALSQALNRLIIRPLIAGDLIVTGDDLEPDLADFGSFVP